MLCYIRISSAYSEIFQLHFFFPGGLSDQHPLGPDNSLETIDFTDTGGGVSLHGPQPPECTTRTTVEYIQRQQKVRRGEAPAGKSGGYAHPLVKFRGQVQTLLFIFLALNLPSAQLIYQKLVNFINICSSTGNF